MSVTSSTLYPVTSGINIRARFHQTFFAEQKVAGDRRLAKNLLLNFSSKIEAKIRSKFDKSCLLFAKRSSPFAGKFARKC
jgi:hypothetical protein